MFFHGDNLSLERFAESLFGDKYYKSVDRHDILFWKKFYISTLEVIRESFGPSVGSIDKAHSGAILAVVDGSIEHRKSVQTKDQIHGHLIVALFKLVFLLMGRIPYRARGKIRNMSTFRTLSYCQTEEQLGWLLQGRVQATAKTLGYIDSIEADMAFRRWFKTMKRMPERSAYVKWVRKFHPEILNEYS